ncbi:dATP/dGTP diphosphohydrolase domain-containing protein [Paenirhodobacter populi]|uniref:dATP/dGTP diphosphohydrolase domain-containing protein n=1 Tax=Paenirhodobacter populi TaxID=2306993 RepID=UPI000FE30615|nr:dATP/dGTP diphosphohydrolase domain-containing protein [Sinirhodobacter populi]RWR09695.1 hypothetical protein D2T32_04955 [Sinirhodobacter populi]
MEGFGMSHYEEQREAWLEERRGAKLAETVTEVVARASADDAAGALGRPPVTIAPCAHPWTGFRLVEIERQYEGDLVEVRECGVCGRRVSNRIDTVPPGAEGLVRDEGCARPAPLPCHPADPKQSAGAAKVPMAALPMAVVAELAVAHGEGAAKYGRHNWRKGEVLASTYYAATLRHLTAWFEGEDIDPDSGLSHLVKAMASLAVLRDAQIHGTALDDRPAPSPEGFMARLCGVHAELQTKLNTD